MKDNRSWDWTSLREETRTMQGRAFELLVGVVVFSIFLSLTINLAASWLFQSFTRQQVLFIMIICGFIVLLTFMVFLLSILTTCKEFHQEIEIFLPLLVSKQDVEVLRIRYYDNVTEPLHAALARCSAEDRKHISQVLQSIHNDNTAITRQEIIVFMLELIQFLFAFQMAQGSARLLGLQAPFRKSRAVMQLQNSTVISQWHELSSQAPSNHYLRDALPNVPQKIILPSGVDLHLSDITQAMDRLNHTPMSKLSEVTLLKAMIGRDTALGITAMVAFSEYGLPKPNAPRLGLTARCILRNARDQRLHDLASEEERIAAQLNDDGQVINSSNQGEIDPIRHYSSLYKKLYSGGQRPYLLRVFIRLDGTFRIRQLGRNEKRLYGLYAWSVDLARLLADMDIEMFMATLKDDGQKTPHRIF